MAVDKVFEKGIRLSRQAVNPTPAVEGMLLNVKSCKILCGYTTVP